MQKVELNRFQRVQLMKCICEINKIIVVKYWQLINQIYKNGEYYQVKLVQKYNMSFIETSALENKNICSKMYCIHR
ncbi:unnamed protein product [Paramecium sonneborni]|uniref:Uncharacterized protein n=1 Tax=Paramecium sonneborni TaxID=65129 RepID=A0A8S1LKQ8_9CILI|nr:unnamed protein product [Paramecium sonneborni]